MPFSFRNTYAVRFLMASGSRLRNPPDRRLRTCASALSAFRLLRDLRAFAETSVISPTFVVVVWKQLSIKSTVTTSGTAWRLVYDRIGSESVYTVLLVFRSCIILSRDTLVTATVTWAPPV